MEDRGVPEQRQATVGESLEQPIDPQPGFVRQDISPKERERPEANALELKRIQASPAQQPPKVPQRHGGRPLDGRRFHGMTSDKTPDTVDEASRRRVPAWV